MTLQPNPFILIDPFKKVLVLLSKFQDLLRLLIDPRKDGLQFFFYSLQFLPRRVLFTATQYVFALL